MRYLREKMATWVEASRVSIPPELPSAKAPHRPNEGDLVEVAFKGDDGAVDGWWDGQVAKIKGDFAYVLFPQQVFNCVCVRVRERAREGEREGRERASGRERDGGKWRRVRVRARRHRRVHTCMDRHIPQYASPAHVPPYASPAHAPYTSPVHIRLTHTHTHTRDANRVQEVVELAALRPAQGHAPGISLIPL